jgi:hypothetical protein
MIIPVYRVVTTQYPIAKATTINAGQAVALLSTGYAYPADSSTNSYCIGLAADTNKGLQAFEWSNRSSDYGNETAASGMISVYNGGGEFWLDVNDGNITRPDGTTLTGAVADISPVVNTKLYVTAAAGVIGTQVGGTSQLVAICLTAAAALDGGIPGEYEPLTATLVDADTPRTWVRVKLLV